MKFIFVFVLLSASALNAVTALTTRYNNPAVAAAPATQHSLAKDLDELARLIPKKEIKRLTLRYLLNDAQFQTFVRLINSYDGYLVHMRFRSQPEVMSFKAWVRSQIMLSGDELQSEESNESIKIFNGSPFWSQNVYGWQGFVNEFLSYYPEDTLRLNVETKSAQNPVFAEFVQRLRNLQVVYERVIALPEAQRLSNALESNGINTAGIDNFIRRIFGWQQTSTNASSAGTH